MDTLIFADQVYKSFGHVKVLKGLGLRIEKGEIVTIVGASGAGKSTLLHILGTLDKPDSGKVLINNQNVFELKDRQISDFRNKNIGFVFQFHHLLPEFTALENICIPAFIAHKNKKESLEKAMKLLGFMKLEHRAGHKPSELSGGEQQRVAVARALINDPDIIFADEPSGNLDSNAAIELHKLFFELRREFGKTLVIVTHNQELARMSDRIITITDGCIV
jgi:lipoprotein-releasing system ATP-binding protein